MSAVKKFEKLEEQLCAFASDGYTGKGSPDRADAMVWAISELMLGSGTVQMFPDFRARHRGADPENACHVYEAADLKDWWTRWVSVTIGSSCAAHWWAREPNGRVRVYRELLAQNSTPEEFGRAIAERSRTEAASHKMLPVWMGESAFEKSGGKCVAVSVAEGIQKSLGEHKAFLFVHNEEERGITDQVKRWNAINARLDRMPNGFLSVQALKGKDSTGWDIVREMLRWRSNNPQTASVGPDWGYARGLLAQMDGYQKYTTYLNGFAQPEAEVLPILMISRECKGMIQAMSGAVRSPDDTALAMGGGTFVLQSLRIGCMASREENASEPLQEFVGRRLEQLSPEASGQSRCIVAEKAEADYKRRHGAEPISFARRRR